MQLYLSNKFCRKLKILSRNPNKMLLLKKRVRKAKLKGLRGGRRVRPLKWRKLRSEGGRQKQRRKRSGM